MRLFTRILLSHLLVVLVVSVSLIVLAGVVSPFFYRDHVELLVEPTEDGIALRQQLSYGHQRTMVRAFLSSLPLALLLAAATAYLEARRIAKVVDRTARASRELAEGRYDKRLKVTGSDELAEIARHFNQLAEALERHERSRNELVASIAHELRTPLSALQGYGEAMSDGVLSPQAGSAAINREVKAMRRVVEDLFLVARLDARAVGLRPTLCGTGDLLFDAYDRFTTVFEDKGVDLRLEGAGPRTEVYVDRDRMIQVLSNLLSNALRHTPAGGSVTLGARADGGEVRFYVTDTGEGIAEEHKPFVFERFYQADAARSRRGHGSGLGLTVAKGLVEAMGGRIGFESALGSGSSFYMTLPLPDAATRSAA
jgi:histidine kinase